MKTRIRETEFGNGTKIYLVQTKYELKDFFYEFGKSFDHNPLGTTMFWFIILIIFFTMMFSWDDKNDYWTIEDAKKDIDNLLKQEKLRIETKEKKKKDEKIIKRNYIKYP